MDHKQFQEWLSGIDQLKDFLRRYRGIETRYLPNYMRWFQRIELENASPRTCLANAIEQPCIRFVN